MKSGNPHLVLKSLIANSRPEEIIGTQQVIPVCDLYHRTLCGDRRHIELRPFRRRLLCAFINSLREGKDANSSLKIRKNKQKTQEKTLDT
jgi:hypothetical protein